MLLTTLKKDHYNYTEVEVSTIRYVNLQAGANKQYLTDMIVLQKRQRGSLKHLRQLNEKLNWVCNITTKIHKIVFKM